MGRCLVAFVLGILPHIYEGPYGMGHTEVYWDADVCTSTVFFGYTLAWIYIMCTCRNPIWYWFRSITPPSSILKWWTLPLGCWWGGGHCLRQHTSRQSYPRRETNKLGGIYFSRGPGYDSLHNIHVAGFFIVDICLLIHLLAGGCKWTSGFQDRRNYY